jgi:hypothetical protein
VAAEVGACVAAIIVNPEILLGDPGRSCLWCRPGDSLGMLRLPRRTLVEPFLTILAPYVRQT